MLSNTRDMRRLSKFENIHGLFLSKFESEMRRTALAELIWCPYIILGRRGLNNRHSLSLSLFFIFFPAYTMGAVGPIAKIAG
jgi:hypothetical protein